MSYFSIILAFCFLMLHIIPTVGASELNREEIINKVTKALSGEGEFIGPVIDYRIAGYDKNSGKVTILVFRGEKYGTAQLESKTLPIVFLDPSNEKVVMNYEKSGELNKLSLVGYIDEEYACFVCFMVHLSQRFFFEGWKS